jgi:hypothetical protein
MSKGGMRAAPIERGDGRNDGASALVGRETAIPQVMLGEGAFFVFLL